MPTTLIRTSPVARSHELSDRLATTFLDMARRMEALAPLVPGKGLSTVWAEHASECRGSGNTLDGLTDELARDQPVFCRLTRDWLLSQLGVVESCRALIRVVMEDLEDREARRAFDETRLAALSAVAALMGLIGLQADMAAGTAKDHVEARSVS